MNIQEIKQEIARLEARLVAKEEELSRWEAHTDELYREWQEQEELAAIQDEGEDVGYEDGDAQAAMEEYLKYKELMVTVEARVAYVRELLAELGVSS